MGVHTCACSLCRHFHELVHPDRNDEMVSVLLGGGGLAIQKIVTRARKQQNGGSAGLHEGLNFSKATSGQKFHAN